MKIKPYIKRILAMTVVVIVVWLFLPSIPEKQSAVAQLTEVTATKNVTHSVSKSVKSSSESEDISEKITSNDSAALVAKAYAAELSFPTYSQPLTDKDFDRLKPNHFNPQSIPIDDVGTTVTAELSKYRYVYPEAVFATLSGENIVNAELQLVDIANGKSLLTRKFEQNENLWTTEFDGARDFPAQLQAVVKAKVNGKNITMALALQYVDSVATLESFDPAFNQAADMVITANLTTREKGLYRIRANLFDVNHQPIAHLVSKDKLSKGSSSIELKAHQSVLQGKQSPFYLSTFSIELMSPAPGKPTKYGDSAISQYEIKDFETSSLSALPYQPSEQEQQRLQLLQNMAQGR